MRFLINYLYTLLFFAMDYVCEGKADKIIISRPYIYMFNTESSF